MNPATERMLAIMYGQREEGEEELQKESDLVDDLEEEEEECEQQEYCVVASEAEDVTSSSDNGYDEQFRQDNNCCKTMKTRLPRDNSDDALYRYPSMFQSDIIYTSSAATQTEPSRYLTWTKTHQILTYLKRFLCTTSFSWTRMVAAVALMVVVVGDIVTLVLGHCYYGLTAGEMTWGVATISSVLLLVLVFPTLSLCKWWFAVHVTYADDWARQAAVCLFNLQVQPVLETFDLNYITKNVNDPVFDWWFIQGLLLSFLVHCIISSNEDEEEDEDEEMNYNAEGQEENGSMLTDVVTLTSNTQHYEDFSYNNEPCEALIEVAVWENNSLVYERREVYGWAEDPGRQNLQEQPQEMMMQVIVGEDNQVSLVLPDSEAQVTP